MMKAAVIVRPRQIETHMVEKPRLNPGEVLIQVKVIGICGTDIHVLHGNHPTAAYPLIPGHEFSGTIIDICESEGSGLQIGDKVVAQEILSCGRCNSCAKGEDNVCEQLRIIGVHRNGGFAEYVKAPIKRVYRFPEYLSFEEAALIEPLAVALHDVRMSGIQDGESALIIGGGPIGLLIGIVLRHIGVSKIVVSEVNEFRKKFAEELGFLTVNPLEEAFDEKLKELSDNVGFHATFEAAGAPGALGTCIEHTTSTGTVVLIAMATESISVDTGKIFAKELRIQGVRIHNLYNFKGAIQLMKNPELKTHVASLISKVFSFEEVLKAFEYAEKEKDALKIVVKF